MTIQNRQLNALANPLHPRHMTTKERLGEVCRILARGIVRLRLRDIQKAEPCGDNPLHFSPDESGGANPSIRRSA